MPMLHLRPSCSPKTAVNRDPKKAPTTESASLFSAGTTGHLRPTFENSDDEAQDGRAGRVESVIERRSVDWTAGSVCVVHRHGAREGERERCTQTSHEAIIESDLEEAQRGDARHTREQGLTAQFHHVE